MLKNFSERKIIYIFIYVRMCLCVCVYMSYCLDLLNIFYEIITKGLGFVILIQYL